MTQTGVSPAVFSGGAVRLNSDSFTQNYLRDMAHQQAQKDATLKYFGELGGKLTDTGMTHEDAEELMNKKNKWQSYVMGNQDKLSNTNSDGGKSYLQSQAMVSEMQDLIDRSKTKAAAAKELIVPIIKDPNKYALLSDESKDAIMKAGLPVSDPNYREIQPTDIKFKEKKFGISDVQKLMPTMAKFKGSYIYDKPVQDKATGSQIQTGHLHFSNEELNGMNGLGNMIYQSNPDFKDTIDKQLDPTSDAFKAKNEIFRSHTGRDINNVQDMITAQMISMNPSPRENQKTGKMSVDPEKMEAIRQKNRVINIGLASSNALAREKAFKDYSVRYDLENEEGKQAMVDNTFDQHFQTALKKPAETIKAPDGSDVSVHLTDVPAVVKPDLAKKVKGHVQQPSKTYVSNDGSTYYGVFTSKGDDDKETQTDVVEAPAADLKMHFRKELLGVPGRVGGTTPAAAPGKGTNGKIKAVY